MSETKKLTFEQNLPLGEIDLQQEMWKEGSH
jgi:hypothetical protein